MLQRIDNALGFAVAGGMREVLRNGYGKADFVADLMSGLTVGVIAVPLAMALAIASGVPPQHGLYTAIVAGAIVALLGGSRLSVSGPTAAFVVILHPIATQFGLGGLILAALLAGIVLIVMALVKLGRVIQFVPYPVTTGFTTGIAVVIASLQLKDFLGLTLQRAPEHFLDRLGAVYQSLPTSNVAELSVASTTLALLILWPKLKTRVPAQLPALLVGVAVATALPALYPDAHIATVGSRFSYLLNGVMGHGIPPVSPAFAMPWTFPGVDGKPLVLSLELLRNLLGPAIAIAMLGAIESLLCAVVVDGYLGTKHDPNAELFGLGVANIACAFLGGIAATGAIARSATNVRTGARSPLAAVMHAVFVLLSVVLLSTWLAYIPMASLAAVLLVTAWNMSEVRHFLRIQRVAPRSDVVVLWVCFLLTVVFDMVIAVSVGVGLAALLFMKEMAGLTKTHLVGEGHTSWHAQMPSHIRLYEITGPLFFGAAERAMSILMRHDDGTRVVVLDLSQVPVIDVTALVALEGAIDRMMKRGVCVALAGARESIRGALAKAGFVYATGRLEYYPTAKVAIEAKSGAISSPD